MPPEFTNLLLPSEIRAFRRMYLFRLVAVAMFGGTLFVCIHAGLLAPTHMLLQKEVAEDTTHLAALAASDASSDAAQLSARLAALSASVASIGKLGSVYAVSPIISKVLDVARVGITLSGISYAGVSGKKPATMILSGTAKTRETLRQYQTVLQKASFIASADVPVSLYAQDKDINFTATLTFAPRP